jgi:putative ABC transport system permease protein
MNGPYALAIFWRERIRFLPAALAVTFSAVLIAVQCGVLLGFLAIASRPIDRAGADIWVGSRELVTLGFSEPIPEAWRLRLTNQPEIAQVEPYYFGWAFWHRRTGAMDQCYIIGNRLEEGSLGAVPDLTAEMRGRLRKPGAVAVYDADLFLLGLVSGVGEVGEISGQRVQVVGRMAEGHKGAGLMPGVFASLRTARLIAAGQVDGDHVTYLLARCRDRRLSGLVARRLAEDYPDMTVLTRSEFSERTQLYWLTRTKAGLALLFAALLGTLVGAVITSQTLYAAIVSSLKQYAVLRALGIPRSRLRGLVLSQSFWVAVAGIVLATPMIFGLRWAAEEAGIDVLLPGWLLAGTTFVAAAMALGSGLSVLPSLRRADPITLLR